MRVDELRQPPQRPDAEAGAAAKLNPDVGRPGLDLWLAVVLAAPNQGLNCNFGRLAGLASKHLDVQRMLGLEEGFAEQRFTQRTVVRKVCGSSRT